MRQMRSTIHVDVTPEDAFDLFVDVQQIPKWYAPKVEVTDVTGRLAAPGDGYTLVSMSAGLTSRRHWAATRVERPRLVEARSAAGTAASIVARFVPATGGTDVTLEEVSEAPLDIELEQSLRNFKALVEAESFVYN
jgi:uncharacterized protein YndB with AHSA1/START domain